MAIGTFAELKTAVANWLDRDDLTSRIPEFVSLAESRIANDVRCRSMFKRVTAVVSTEYFDAPTDLLQIGDIQINTDPISPLSYLSPKMMSEKYRTAVTGTPKHYTIIGDEIQVKPNPSGNFTLEIAHYARYAALSLDADTNWLLTNHPGIYLYATLMEAEPYLENDSRTALWSGAYETIISKLEKSESRGQQGAVMVSRVNTATP